jgi:hypothetical protein
MLDDGSIAATRDRWTTSIRRSRTERTGAAEAAVLSRWIVVVLACPGYSRSELRVGGENIRVRKRKRSYQFRPHWGATARCWAIALPAVGECPIKPPKAASGTYFPSRRRIAKASLGWRFRRSKRPPCRQLLTLYCASAKRQAAICSRVIISTRLSTSPNIQPMSWLLGSSSTITCTSGEKAPM